MSQTTSELILQVKDGKGKEQRFSFAKNSILIGRAVSCDVSVDEASAGKEHARIEILPEGAVRLVDLGTSTGTHFKEERLSGHTLLSDGDQFQIGSTTVKVLIKKVDEQLVKTEMPSSGKWKSYEIPSKPVINVAQLWGDNVVAVNRFGKSAKHLLHSFFYLGIIIFVEAWLVYNFYQALHKLYLAGKLDDYGPALMMMIITLLIADVIAGLMTYDLFVWPRETQFRAIRIGQTKDVDFFVPEELLGEKFYNLIVSYKGKPALNLANPKIKGRILMEGQILTMDELKKTSFIKNKELLPLNYKTRARLEIGHITFILGLDPSLMPPKGALIHRINVPIAASFGLAFFINALFLVAVMASPRSQEVVKINISQTRTFKTLITAEKEKKKDDEQKKKEAIVEKKEEDSEKEKDEALKEEAEKDPLLEEKVQQQEEKRVIKKTVSLELTPKKTVQTDLAPKNEKKRLQSMTALSENRSKDDVRKKVSNLGALAGANKMLGIGSDFGDAAIDNAFKPVGDLALSGLSAGSDGGIDLGGTSDGDPFDLSKIESGSPGVVGEGVAFEGTLGADGTAIAGNKASLAGKDLEELQKAKLSKEIKGPKFDEKKVKIQPPSNFDMEGTGKLDKEVVKKYIRNQLAKIRWCYQQGFQKNPNLEGKVTVSFIISPTGTVMTAKVTNSTLGDAEVESCIEAKVKTWRFPAPQGGGVVKVNYPFVLRRQ